MGVIDLQRKRLLVATTIKYICVTSLKQNLETVGPETKKVGYTQQLQLVNQTLRNKLSYTGCFHCGKSGHFASYPS